MNTFFDLNGRLGRWDYFKRWFIRGLIFFFASFSYISILYTFSQTISPDTTPLFKDWVAAETEARMQNPYSVEGYIAYLLGLLLWVPIEIRRANDIHLKWKWLIPAFVGFLIPWDFIDNTSIGLAIFILYRVYCVVIGFILFFRTGETFKEWVRAKDRST